MVRGRDLIKLITTGCVARVAVDAIIHAMRHSSTASRDAPARKEKIGLDPFFIFASNVVYRSEVRVPAILVSLVYIKRAKQHLFIQSPEWACERVFLGALIRANKVGIRLHTTSSYTDSGLNVHEPTVFQRLVDQELPLGSVFWCIR